MPSLTRVLIPLLRHLPGGVLLALVLLACLPVGADAPRTGAPLRLDQAEFMVDGSGLWQPVALPDSWRRRDQPTDRSGLYRLTLQLDRARLEHPGALWIERLPTRHRVRVNDHLLVDRLSQPQGALTLGSLLLPVPPVLLREGRNLVEIEVGAGLPRAGLSAPLYDDAEALERGALWAHQQGRLRLQLVNAAASGIALFMLMLWSNRRQEQALGCFGLLALLATLRNQAYFSGASPVPGPASGWLFFLAQIGTAVLLGHFVLLHTGLQRPRLRRALDGGALLIALLGTAGFAAGEPDLTRQLAYPPLLGSVLVALALLVRHSPGHSLPARALMPLGLGAVLVAGLHDYAYQIGLTSVMDDYWMPAATPLIVAGFALRLLARLAEALRRTDLDRAELEQRVEQRTRALEAAVQARDRFLAAASHDLRQPMATMRMLISLLQDHAREQAGGATATAAVPARHTLDLLGQRLDEAGRAMEELLGGLLDLSRLEGGRTQVQRQAVALQPLLRAIAADCDVQAHRKGLRLIVHPTDAVVDADALLLEQILRNLVGNAVQHTRRGGVLVGARPAGPGRLRLVVLDTGPGIDPAQQQRVFDEFVQLNNPGRDRRQGVGLGLAIVRRCATLLGAPLSLRSVPGRGSCFSLELPRARPAAPTGSVVPAEVAEPAAPHRALPLEGRHIWLIEDDALLRDALRQRLGGWGARVVACESLRELDRLIEQTGEAAPDTLLTDLRLPDGDGLQAAARLRGRHPRTAVLIVTGDVSGPERQRLQRCGHPVLPKPCSAQALLAALGGAGAAP
ncbi:ATP-binding response regulator [Sphaerotilus uruguayifluvii]|uniref:histidine kinase n=1 Tax=Sphaerotilus uruguayifluvii TaxID=2735897 RepID=A0ABX2G0D9_9BURK|nr:hybrid sensor histidine kinase/response regulator [Leptothrix sp. C29]NRT55755.1 signal transduction histidine kinase/CheY-like chemotaxis protein [Leptothrix sp. C29]